MAKPKDLSAPNGTYVYTWRRPDTNQPFYVGVGVNNRAWRLIRRNAHTLNIIKKYGGIENIVIEINPVPSWEDGVELEQTLIARYGRKDLGQGPLTNMTDGGEGAVGRVVSESGREAVAKANAKRVWTEEQKQAVREKLTGREVSEKTRKILADKFSGKLRPPHVQKILKSNLEQSREAAIRWSRSPENKKVLKQAQEEAKKWHASEEGLAWHRENGKKAWENKAWYSKDCTVCGREYMTPFPSRSKYCHQNCRATALRRRRGKEDRGRKMMPDITGKRSPETGD